ncbi:MAG: prmA [Ilumatobacteraceae bacterium]|jgi:ribosomal protein L11 methyltransferase|nr:prmA [Ilumatobacteraceae bacterium]
MLALVIALPAGEVELASDALWALGVVAIEERDGEHRIDDHYVELWTSLGDDADTVAKAAEGFPARWRWRLVEVDETVAETWRAHVTPTWVADDVVICPAWIPVEAPSGTVVLRIEPGATFGLGNHPTTVLTVRALRASLFPGATVLDVGCGSGVLGVAACAFGAGRVDAIDLSPAAVGVTAANAARNGFGGRIAVSTTPIGDVDDSYDVVVANILAPTLIEMAGDLRRVLGPAGVLVISGVLSGRFAHVVDALAPLQVIAVDELEGWAAVTLRW